MKYMITLCYGNDGRAVVDVPRVDSNADMDYWDDENTIICAGIKAGYVGFYPYMDIVEEFIEFSRDYNGEEYTPQDISQNDEIADEFWLYTDDCNYTYIDQLDCFIQNEGLFIQPVPPNYEVGAISYGENPRLRRYQGMGR